VGVVHHPLFARVFERVSTRAEAAGQAEHRRTLLADLKGRVVEIGAGNGLNFRHYPASVTELVAVEPEPYLRERARKAAAGAEIQITVVDGTAEDLPAPDATFDAAVASLVLCSVIGLPRAIEELHRVIRPGGELRFYEHVLSRRHGFARLQRAADTIWPMFAGGCHTARNTVAAIESAGFTIERLDRFPFRPCRVALPVTPHVLGRARRP
jgi:ubiquinone/menaquinone biosynthesis C-methylase UbiE